MKLKRIFLKVFSLIFVVATLQVALYALFPARWLRISQFVKVQQLARSGVNGSILFFGDSVINTTGKSDRDKSSVATLFQTKIGGLPTANLSSPGYPPSLYRSFTQYIFKMQGNAPLYIYPINMRSLTSQLSTTEFVLEKRVLARAHQPLVFPFVYPLLVFSRVASVNDAQSLTNKPDRNVALISGKWVYRYHTELEPTLPEVEGPNDIGNTLTAREGQRSVLPDPH